MAGTQITAVGLSCRMGTDHCSGTLEGSFRLLISSCVLYVCGDL